MQFVRYTTGSVPQWGVRCDDKIVPLAGLREEVSYKKLTDPGFLHVIEDAVIAASDQAISVAEAALLAPIPRSGKVICVGLNYHDHAEEQDGPVPERPLLFGKTATAVTNPGDPIVHPAGLDEVASEVGLGVVIGRTTKDATAANARDHVAGYTVVNDISGRGAQFDDEQWFRGKSYDTFSPMGPCLVPNNHLDPHNLDVACRVNGKTKQTSNTNQFIFDVDDLIEYVSNIMTLRPGDVISTGTPSGVGTFHDPPELLEPDDTVEVEIEGIGTLINPIIAEQNLYRRVVYSTIDRSSNGRDRPGGAHGTP